MQTRLGQSQLEAQRRAMANITAAQNIQGVQGVYTNPIKSISHQEWNQMMDDLQELKEAIKKLKGE